MTALPELKFFTDVPYSDEWREEFKDFFQTLPDANDALYHLNRFTKHLSDIKDETQRKKKGVQLVNRLHELKKKIYLQQYKVDSKDLVEKVGCVVVRKNNDALFTKVTEGGGVKYGFPKGQYEYKLQNKDDIYTVKGEGLANGALRELKEETGFELTGKINVHKGIYTGVLERKLDNKTDRLPIVGGSNAVFGNGFYLILFVMSNEDLKTHDVPKNEEGITGVVWQEQYVQGSPRSYNTFSQHKFQFPSEDFFNVENGNASNLNGISPSIYKKQSAKRKTLKKAKRPDESSKKHSKGRYTKTRSKTRSR
jgi:8-oxo-dGTP pyrophosphatase MutT (NUDIX family)